MQNILKKGICVIILSCNAYFVFSSTPQDSNNLSEIYYSKKLDNNQKRDSIINTFFKNTPPVSQLQYADELIKLAELHNDFQWIYRAYYFKGNAYIYMAELDKAYEVYLKSLKAVQAGNIKEGTGDIYLGIGNSFSIGKDHDQAILYYNKALTEYKSNSDTTYMGYVLLNIINEYHNINNLDSVKTYISLATSLYNAKKDKNIKAYLHGYNAMLLAKTNNHNASLKEFEKSQKLFTERGRIYDIISFQTEMAKILTKKDNYNSAKDFAIKCYEQAKNAHLKSQIRDASLLLSEIYKNLGKLDKAFQYQAEYISYKDSVSNEETIRKMADMRTEYEVSQKQIEIDFLEKKRSINKIALITAVTILIILIVLTYLLYRNNKIIKKQATELHELNQTKDKMFSIISHDLRSPLSSITGYFSFLKELALAEQTDKVVEISDEMMKSLQNINSLLDNLLNWATNQQEKIPYKPEYFSVHEICTPLVEVFENSAKAKGVSLYLNVDENIKIFADKNTFATIFRNLIGNAIKFTEDGDSVTLECIELPDKIKISVIDTGIGIVKEKLATLFDLDGNKSTWGTANEKGVGLGLRLAYEFTELNKGKIYVESETGVGTTFYVEFPKTTS